MNLDAIRQFWAEQARVHKDSPAASWSDIHAIDLEIRQIASRLHKNDRVIDIGCANGYSTVALASRVSATLRGVDYIPEMVEYARGRMQSLPASLRNRISFDVGDILDLQEPDGAYDAAVVVRVLINLESWERQQKALAECARVIRSGGRLLLSEATLQGWRRLNRFRTEWRLTEIPMPDFNTYLDEDRLVEAAAQYGLELREISNFASTYFVGTRILKPLLAKVAGNGVDAANPKMEWNRFFAQLPAWGDYGTQKLFIFNKV